MNFYLLLIMTAVVYVMFGLIFMGIDSRWKISVYINAFSSDPDQKHGFQKRLKEKRQEWEASKKGYLVIMFFFWWVYLFVAAIQFIIFACFGVMDLVRVIVSSIWFFFYNGFRVHPPSEKDAGSDGHVK